MEFDLLSKQVIGCAIEVHRELGPGLLESAYEKCLLHELQTHNIQSRNQVILPVEYKGMHLDAEYRIDLIVENKLIIELKSVETLLPIHSAQLLTYMKLAKTKIGLLINFNNKLLKNGIKRLVL
jgi:GxxExxY protein